MKRSAGLVVLALVFATACAARSESRARPIDRRDVPFGLSSRESGTEAPDGGDDSLAVYLVGSDRLVEVTRSTRSARRPDVALEQLLAGPTEEERTAGLATALPTSGVARLLETEGTIAHVRLSSGFRDGTVPNQVTALAQIVYTLTALPGIEAVSFAVGDRDVAVPRGDGSLTERPVGRDDYLVLLSISSP